MPTMAVCQRLKNPEIYHHHIGKRIAMPTYVEILDAGYFDLCVVIVVGKFVCRKWPQATSDKKSGCSKIDAGLFNPGNADLFIIVAVGQHE